MTTQPNAAATEHLPFFITPPGGTDVLLYVMVVFILLFVVGLGVIFLTIHHLPERIAHRTKKVQLEIVAVLTLVAMFTHENVLWVAAQLLAYIDIPDFMTPVRRIASAVENIAGEETEGEVTSSSETAKPAVQESLHAPGETPFKKAELVETPRQSPSVPVQKPELPRGSRGGPRSMDNG